MSDSAPKPLTNKIDFAVIISVRRANPNGDPLNGNRPRQTYDGYGEISDVCLKRKVRNRLQDMGDPIFVQSDDNRAKDDNFRSLRARFDSEQFVKDYKEQQKAKTKSKKKASGQKSLSEEIDIRKKVCERWFDVRTFGQVFAFEKIKAPKQANADEAAGADTSEKDSTDDEGDTAEGNSDAVSIGIRGPVTIQSAFSIEPITPDSLQITKSCNLKTETPPEKKGGDTMGMKHRVDKGIYVTYGAINTQLASKTGFSDADAEKIKVALQSLFVNDVSSARPEGSMEVVKVIWWKHNSPCGQYSSAKVHRSLKVDNAGAYKLDELTGLKPEELDELEGSGLQP